LKISQPESPSKQYTIHTQLTYSRQAVIKGKTSQSTQTNTQSSRQVLNPILPSVDLEATLANIANNASAILIDTPVQYY